MRRNGVRRCARLVEVSLALCLLTAVPALGSESTITSAGSGFAITADGYILTNEHVVGDSETVNVFVDGIAYPATVVTKSVESDLALLKIAASGLTPVALGDSLSVQLLDDVVALGYPLPQFGRDLTVSEGRITSFRTNVGGREGRDTLQHDAVITHGSSGGPLFSLKGEVIGVNFAGVEGSGMQLAIPINEAVPLLRSIPSFSPSSMGRATQMLAAQDVVALYAKSVVYIEVAAVVDWQGFLPDPNSIQGFQSEELWDAEVWVEWLGSLGFDVSGAAGLSGQRQGEYGYYNEVAMVALPNPESAQAVLDLLFGPVPPSPIRLTCGFDTLTRLSDGVATLGGCRVTYPLDFGGRSCCQKLGIAFDLCWKAAGVYGVMVFAMDNLVFRVSCGWDRVWDTRGVDRGFLVNPSCEGGYLYADFQQLISVQEVLNRLEQLTNLVIATARNKLAGR